jgi:hypothetical protein
VVIFESVHWEIHVSNDELPDGFDPHSCPDQRFSLLTLGAGRGAQMST